MSATPAMNRPLVPRKPQGDSIYAVWKATYYMTEGNAVKEMKGYSKFTGQTENSDPASSLLGFVSRLISNGYLEKTYYMEFYTNAFYSDRRQELVVELTPDNYELHGIAQAYYPLKKILDDVYAMKKNKLAYKDIAAQYKQGPKAAKKAEDEKLFKFDPGRFKSEKEFGDYCQWLQDVKGYPRGRCVGFFQAYRKTFVSLKEADLPLVQDLANKWNINKKR
ncbi:hypothetical protein [Siphonobacter sp.]|uniref:hypothetical protein n=1 Tax=Siphonobacter sp. TaxID=1869184 RepID=UPI003B3AD64A